MERGDCAGKQQPFTICLRPRKNDWQLDEPRCRSDRRRMAPVVNLVRTNGTVRNSLFPERQGDPSGTGSGLTSTAAGWDPAHRAQHADLVPGVSVNPSGKGRLNWVNGGAFTCPVILVGHSEPHAQPAADRELLRFPLADSAMPK